MNTDLLPCAFQDEYLLHDGGLDPEVGLYEDPLQHLALVHLVHVAEARHAAVEERNGRQLLEPKIGGQGFAGDLDEGQLVAVKLIINVLQPVQHGLVRSLLLLTVEKHSYLYIQLILMPIC